jgi:predicted nucleic acid-binding protein
MVVCCDTSFLFALYGNDAHTAKARKHLLRESPVIALTLWNRYELENALRLAEFRKLIPSGGAARLLQDVAEDLEAGRLSDPACNLGEVLNRARSISSRHTLGGGHRAFDILHLAGALEMGAECFLTFDRNQAALAASLGLRLPLSLSK